MILKMKYYSGRQVHNIITETIAGKTLADVLERFAKEPSADVQEVRRGRWKCVSIGRYACSLCGREPWYEGSINTMHYCPYCGAKMEGEQNG